MIVWINGPFGVGKTTLACHLHGLIPGSVVFDPEMIGTYVQWLQPLSPGEDYQDRPIWRSMTSAGIRLVHLTQGGTIIVPMTLVNAGYLKEIHQRISHDGRDIVHVFLDTDEPTIRERIERDTVECGAREWRLAQLQRCLAARSSMPGSTILLDTRGQTPDTLAKTVATMVA
ncbi:MAG TPA: AAA family ATPase [Thermomicrobiales bacterium]|nr:AAA family ATPase [Thermomicrobiales bacterium]